MSTSFKIVLKDEKYKEPISPRLAELIKMHVGKEDIIEAAEKTGVHIVTLKGILTRNRVLAETNEPAVIELMNIALQNIERGQQHKLELKVAMQEIEVEPNPE
ncbi:MAG TPA: hypothetical protein VFM70_10645 [Salinimicrobium sp.]|nr:hypothetical protein [Salinimicrobium sp.]